MKPTGLTPKQMGNHWAVKAARQRVKDAEKALSALDAKHAAEVATGPHANLLVHVARAEQRHRRRTAAEKHLAAAWSAATAAEFQAMAEHGQDCLDALESMNPAPSV